MAVTVVSFIIFFISLVAHLSQFFGLEIARNKRFNHWLLLLSALGYFLLFIYLCLSPSNIFFIYQTLASALSVLFLSLANTVSAIIYRFNHNYLHQSEFDGWADRQVAACVLAIHAFLLSSYLPLMVLAWLALGIPVHKIVSYNLRSNPVKWQHAISFVLSNTCLLLATLIAFHQYHTLWLIELPKSANLTTTLIGISFIIRCAQFPFYRWMFELINKPTTLSALMHAGVINLGSLAMIAYASILLANPINQWLCLLFGLLTIIEANHHLNTEYRYKHRLVYSTAAQMGFLFVELGLGFTMLASIHLIAHALYKANRFIYAANHPLSVKYHQPTSLSLSLYNSAFIFLFALMLPILSPFSLSHTIHYSALLLFVVIISLFLYEQVPSVKEWLLRFSGSIVSFSFIATLLTYSNQFTPFELSYFHYYFFTLSCFIAYVYQSTDKRLSLSYWRHRLTNKSSTSIKNDTLNRVPNYE